MSVAFKLGRSYVGTEHVLLALFDGRASPAAVLAELGADRDRAKAEIVDLLRGLTSAREARRQCARCADLPAAEWRNGRG